LAIACAAALVLFATTACANACCFALLVEANAGGDDDASIKVVNNVPTTISRSQVQRQSKTAAIE